MTITLPADVQAQAERQAKAAGFASVEAYVVDLVREDADGFQYPDVPPRPGRSFSTREELEKLLDETLGQPVLRIDDSFWEQLDEQIRTRAAELGITE